MITKFWNKIKGKRQDHQEGVLYACHESKAEALQGAQRDVSSINWLRMLGILEFHPTAADLVYLGSVQDQGRDPPADTNRIIPLSLVLGNVLPWVCVNGDVFVKYFARDDLNGNEPPENPIEKGLTSLRALNTQFAPPLRRHTRRSAEPQAPREQGLHTRQLPPSMGDPVHVHGPGPRIVSDGDMDAWMDANLAQYDADRANRILMEIVPSIRVIWAGWRSRPDVATQVPRLFFAHIKPSWVFVDRAVDHPAGTNGEGQDQEA